MPISVCKRNKAMVMQGDVANNTITTLTGLGVQPLVDFVSGTYEEC